MCKRCNTVDFACFLPFIKGSALKPLGVVIIASKNIFLTQ